ncbi:hypothetical protein GC197_04605 [bacterium]|nr:hypothetical protein [bacterium]
MKTELDAYSSPHPGRFWHMVDGEEMQNQEDGTPQVNSGYAAFQLGKAITTSSEHEDQATRQRALEKAAKWQAVLQNFISGSVAYGSRTPVGDLPAWVTLEVVTGGFATGNALAGGELTDDERARMQSFPDVKESETRRFLNASCLTDEGLAELQARLSSGCYDISVPEEGALLVVAWLVEHGHTTEAQALLDEIASYFASLRFYPMRLEQPRQFGSRVHVQTVKETTFSLEKIKPNRQVLAQKEAIEIWAPYYDRLIGMFWETIVDDRPYATFPEDWNDRAAVLLDEYEQLRQQHRLCAKPHRAKGHAAQLRRFLSLAVERALNDRQITQIKFILDCYAAKRGAPNSDECRRFRSQQREYVRSPLHHEIAKVVLARLNDHDPSEGLDEVGHLQSPVDTEEATKFALPAATQIPKSIQRKLERCLNQTVAELVARGLITSGEVLAKVLPQMTSQLRAAGITDPSLRQLYAAIYRAFRRRRSLLLLNLEKQVQLEELPWVAAIDRFRIQNVSQRDLASQALQEVVSLTLVSFPYAILPNKLLQEVRALAKTADLKLPIVDEVAADIFMGQFSDKFVAAAKQAASMLEGSLYQTYYDIDFDKISQMSEGETRQRFSWLRQARQSNGFAELCASRAGVKLGTWDPATNGMIIEQQQILTTQNLAVLFDGMSLTHQLHGRLPGMIIDCFQWICRRQQMKIDRRHAQIVMLKNTAYAWRQMIFFLSLLSESELKETLQGLQSYLESQSPEFVTRFRPAFNGLLLAAEGKKIPDVQQPSSAARRFLGWSKKRHWLAPPTASKI